MVKSIFLLLLLTISSHLVASASEVDLKKSHLEDIFIWKMSDELRLTAQQERQFTEINKLLNKKKSELNRKIQESIQKLTANDSDMLLRKHKKLIQEYNEIAITEFDSIKKLLGNEKFVSYLKIKNELTTKIKSILIGDKAPPEKDDRKLKQLPPPKVIVEAK